MRLIEQVFAHGTHLNRENGTSIDYACYKDGKIALNGIFDLEDLEAIVYYMKAKNETIAQT
jgi:hypothetical protein